MGKGGIIGKSNNPSANSASGMWSLREQYGAKKNRVWPLNLNPFAFNEIISYFSGQNFSLYDFRPGANSIYSDTGLTTSITTGGVAIAGVKDLGTNSRNLTQSTLGNRPTSAADGPAIFNGSTTQLNTTASSLGIQTCVIVAKINSETPSFSGLVTNQTDQSTNVDLAFTTLIDASSWETTQATGGGLATSTRFWRNKSTQTAAITFNTLCCYSNDGTNHPAALNFPNGLRVGTDRNNAGRFLNGTIGAIFIHSSTILSDTDRNYVEDKFNEAFAVY